MIKPNKQVHKINKLNKLKTDKKIIIMMLRIIAEVALDKLSPTFGKRIR